MIYTAYSEQNQKISGITFVSCGHIFAKPNREIFRPNGRDDCLLFFVANESETFFFEKTEVAKPGSFVIFAPHEKQHHVYKGNKTAEFYYLHFKCENLSEIVPLKTSKVYETNLNRQVCDLFESIIEETLQKQPFYEKVCIYKFLYLLSLLERGVLSKNHPDKENFKRVGLVVQHMNKHYDGNYSLNDYAKMCAMSKFHFLRVFEKIVGTSPIEYRNNIRMQHALDLILDEKLSLEQISDILGFSSASYFSTMFKQKYGCSPKQHKKQKSDN